MSSNLNYQTTLNDPNLKFEVGEKVVITAAGLPWLSSKYYADENEFCFSTIKEVLEDGSVITTDGIKFKQAKEKRYGEYEYFYYFKSTTKKKLIINHKCYKMNDYGKCSTERYLYSWEGENVFLFKCDATWEKRAKEINKKAKEYKEEKAREEKHYNARQVFKDAYKQELKPLEEELWRKQIELWKKHMCANCMHNCNGFCKKWRETIETYEVSECSAFDIEEDE